jgi:sugar phosphate isomerase/epimerase
MQLKLWYGRRIMKTKNGISRRSFLGSIAVAPLAAAMAHSKQIPVGLELYSVRDDLQKDLMGTVRSVAKMGYQCVEFYGPYYAWTPEYARQVRAELDELGIQCHSTHNGLDSFTPAGIGKAIDLNKILGTRYIVNSSAGNLHTLDDWKRAAEILNKANDTLKAQGLHVGYHNHDAEWKLVEGKKPIEVLAATLDKSIMLQLDVGTCLAAGSDPVDWINRNPGRIRSMHLKDWSSQKQYKVLFGGGIAPWKKIFAAAEKIGGVEYYLIEQEGSDYSELETARRCLAAYHKVQG